MPTVDDLSPRFVLVPLDPFLLALGSALPAGSRPTEMWLGIPDADRLPTIQAALAEPPFRFAQVTSREAHAAERSSDPLSQAIVWTLVLAAVAGLVLSVGGLILGAQTDLRDERGELADLEAQGVAPSDLRRRSIARAAWLLVGGSTAGLVVGLVLTFVVTEALSVTAEGTVPVPPLRVIFPIGPIAAVILGVATVVLAATAWLAHRTYGRATLGERRSRGRGPSNESSTVVLHGEAGHGDG
jgi:hypothetical protein